MTRRIGYKDFTQKQWETIAKANIYVDFYPLSVRDEEFVFDESGKYLTEESEWFKMRYNNMHCCGFRELGYFPYEFDDHEVKRFKNVLGYYQEYLDYYWGNDHDDEECMAVCCTLSEDQRDWWKIVEKEGFQKAWTWRNINSSNEVRLYVKDFYPNRDD